MKTENKIKFIALGGAEEIGASCFYLNIDGTGILLDCGIHPQRKGFDALPRFELLDELDLDYVIISHAHQDHIGALPFLIKKFPHAKILATPQTIEVAILTLHNSVRILSEVDEDMLVYTHEEVDLLLQCAFDIKYEEEFYLKGLRHSSSEPIKLRFYDAGHIIGSASILLEYLHERILYTGDIKLSKQFLMNGAILPGERITTLITESTYGNTPSEAIGNLRSEISRFVTRANSILSSGGSILIPVFALGKMQEILWMIHSQIVNGRLTNVPIFTGGLANKILKIYDKNRYVVNYTSSENVLSDINTFNYFELNDFHKVRKNPCIVIASSGMMLPNTSSNRFAKFWLTQNNFAIFIVGYMDDQTPGSQVANAKKGDLLENFSSETQVVKCDIERFYFPTHSNRNELIQLAHRLNPGRILLIHGDDNAKQWIGENCMNTLQGVRINSVNVGQRIII